MNPNFAYTSRHELIHHPIYGITLPRLLPKIQCLPYFYRLNFVCTTYLHTNICLYAFILLFKVTPGGKADLQGILEGDLIDEINNEPTEHLVHLDAQNLIKSSKDILKLGLIR